MITSLITSKIVYNYILVHTNNNHKTNMIFTDMLRASLTSYLRDVYGDEFRVAVGKKKVYKEIFDHIGEIVKAEALIRNDRKQYLCVDSVHGLYWKTPKSETRDAILPTFFESFFEDGNNKVSTDIKEKSFTQFLEDHWLPEAKNKLNLIIDHVLKKEHKELEFMSNKAKAQLEHWISTEREKEKKEILSDVSDTKSELSEVSDEKNASDKHYTLTNKGEMIIIKYGEKELAILKKDVNKYAMKNGNLMYINDDDTFRLVMYDMDHRIIGDFKDMVSPVSKDTDEEKGSEDISESSSKSSSKDDVKDVEPVCPSVIKGEDYTLTNKSMFILFTRSETTTHHALKFPIQKNDIKRGNYSHIGQSLWGFGHPICDCSHEMWINILNMYNSFPEDHKEVQKKFALNDTKRNYTLTHVQGDSTGDFIRCILKDNIFKFEIPYVCATGSYDDEIYSHHTGNNLMILMYISNGKLYSMTRHIVNGDITIRILLDMKDVDGDILNDIYYIINSDCTELPITSNNFKNYNLQVHEFNDTRDLCIRNKDMIFAKEFRIKKGSHSLHGEKLVFQNYKSVEITLEVNKSMNLVYSDTDNSNVLIYGVKGPIIKDIYNLLNLSV